jgi:hypothetical protein
VQRPNLVHTFVERKYKPWLVGTGMKRLNLILLLVWCSGCAHDYGIKSIARSGSLRTNASALVVLPEDVELGDLRYPGSGREVALAIKHALATRLESSDLTLKTGGRKAHLNVAKERNIDYLVVPMVFAWEDETLNGMGRSQRAAVELQFIETESGRMIAMGRVEGSGKRDPASTEGPHELLEVPLQSYVNWITSPPGTPLPQPRAEPALRGRK